MIATFKRIIRECGRKLLELSEQERAKGVWQVDQFKAEADKTAHHLFVKAFRAESNLPIVSEEDENPSRFTSSDYVILDPIDGTASYSHGYNGWVTQAALMRNQKPILSVVFAPAINELFWAEVGKGAFCNDTVLRVRSGQSDQITSLIDNYPTPRGITEEVVDNFTIPYYVECGSLGLKICRVASGSADLLFKAMCPRDWDLAAPGLIIKEAGGVLTDALAQEIQYGSVDRSHHGLIASCNTQIMNRVSSWYRQKVR